MNQPNYLIILSLLCFIWLLSICLINVFYSKEELEDNLSNYKPFPHNTHEIFPDYNINPYKPLNVSRCNWRRGRNFTLTYDYSKKNECKKIIKYANALNLTYFLSFGSELQAYRNNGYDKGDHDIDIIVPIYLNPHLFNCSDFIPINRNKYKFNSVLFDHAYRLCGRRRRHYFKRFIRYVDKTLGYYKKEIWSYSVQLYVNSKMPFLDVWLIMSNEYVYDKLEFCKCEFCGVETYCMKNALKNIIKNYGKDFMTPISVSSDQSYIIPSP